MGGEVGVSERVERSLYKGASGSAALDDNPDTHTSRDQGRKNVFPTSAMPNGDRIATSSPSSYSIINPLPELHSGHIKLTMPLEELHDVASYIHSEILSQP